MLTIGPMGIPTAVRHCVLLRHLSNSKLNWKKIQRNMFLHCYDIPVQIKVLFLSFSENGSFWWNTTAFCGILHWSGQFKKATEKVNLGIALLITLSLCTEQWKRGTTNMGKFFLTTGKSRSWYFLATKKIKSFRDLDNITVDFRRSNTLN